MIARSHRFHGRGSLNYVYSKGRSVRGEFVSLRFAPSKKSDYRLAVVVSKKVSKSAVTRNRIRRRIYEIIRQTKKLDSRPWPYDLILTVFDDRLATLPSEQLRAHIISLLQKAGVGKHS